MKNEKQPTSHFKISFYYEIYSIYSKKLYIYIYIYIHTHTLNVHVPLTHLQQLSTHAHCISTKLPLFPLPQFTLKKFHI